MLQGLTILVLFQTAGDLLQNLAGVPIPGPVIGMALLLAALTCAKVPECVDRTATALLTYLPMLFVPAGVGVLAHFDLIRAEWPAIAAGIVFSSILAIGVTATTMQVLEHVQRLFMKIAWRRMKQGIREGAG